MRDQILAFLAALDAAMATISRPGIQELTTGHCIPGR